MLVFVTRAALKERQYSAVMAATGLLYLAILTAFGTDLVARRARSVANAAHELRDRFTSRLFGHDGAMARPVWTGTISFGLVAIPVKLFHAVRRQSVSFNQLDDRTMSRIKYKKVSALDGEEVPDEHIVKGYEVSKERYIVVDPDELEPFIPSATKTVELEEFVDLDEIDPGVLRQRPTTWPRAPTPKPYVLLARAMEESGKVAIGRFVMRNKQYTAAIRAENGRLVMSTLAYADEVIDPAEIDELQGLDDVDVSAKEVAMAESLVQSLDRRCSSRRSIATSTASRCST